MAEDFVFFVAVMMKRKKKRMAKEFFFIADCFEVEKWEQFWRGRGMVFCFLVAKRTKEE